MSSRALFSLALLAGAVLLERFAYYAHASTFALTFYKEVGDLRTLSTLLSLRMGVSLVGILAGGAIAFAAGPRTTAAVGASLAALGYRAFVFAGTSVPAMTMLAFGEGLFRAPPFAAAAEIAIEEEAPLHAPPSTRCFTTMTAIASIPLLCLSALACLGAGVVVAVLARRLHGRYFDPQPLVA